MRAATTAADRRARLIAAAVSPFVVVGGELGFVVNQTAPRGSIPLDLSVSVSSVLVGLIVWRRRPLNTLGPLLVLAGWLWAIPGIGAFDNPWTFAISSSLNGVYDVVFAHLLLAYPTGRLETRRIRALVLAAYGLIVLTFSRVLVLDAGATCCPKTTNALQVWDNPAVARALEVAGNVAGVAIALTGIGVVAVRWVRATGVARRIYTPVFAAAIILAVTAAPLSAFLALGIPNPDWIWIAYAVGHLVIPLAFLYGIVRADLGRGVVADLVVRLSGQSFGLQEGLSRALHDPTLEVAYWDAGRQTFVDIAGDEIVLPPEGAAQVATMVDRNGVRLAAIVHDRALLQDQRLVESVSVAAGLALDNERLAATVRTQLDHVRASRARLVEAADEERRRVERDLHDGAQQRLLAMVMSLRRVQAMAASDPQLRRVLEETETHARSALSELRELAQGIHPAILTEEGLSAALEQLAERAPLPVHLRIAKERFPSPVESTAYFAVAELLTNVVKHACASRIDVCAVRVMERLQVAVSDDGVGGANATGGSGLRGLADRAAALDGSMTIESECGRGTTVRLEIPLVARP